MSLNNNKLPVILALLLCSVHAYAGLKGLDGLDVVINILYGGAIAGCTTLVSWVLMFMNGTRERKGLAIASFIFSLPLFILGCYCLINRVIPLGLSCFAVLMLTWWLLYRSSRPGKEKVTGDDME